MRNRETIDINTISCKTLIVFVLVVIIEIIRYAVQQ
nr:MAG TPA: hypothetical protein [Caudoviricetes sp.]